jgi:hypothetical protein
MRGDVARIVGWLALVLGAPAIARAGVCASVCGTIKSTCGTAAITAFRGCRLDARQMPAGDVRLQAIIACRTTLRSSRQDCIGRAQGCRTTCQALPSGDCIHGCVTDIRACIGQAAAQGRACITACPPPPDGIHCRADCAQTANATTHQCGLTFGTCAAACGGSPAGSFVD